MLRRVQVPVARERIADRVVTRGEGDRLYAAFGSAGGGGSVPTGTGGVLDMGDRMDAGASYDGGARV